MGLEICFFHTRGVIWARNEILYSNHDSIRKDAEREEEGGEYVVHLFLSCVTQINEREYYDRFYWHMGASFMIKSL